MCVKLPPGDLNPDPCSPPPTNIYTCKVTTTPKVCGGKSRILKQRPCCIPHCSHQTQYPRSFRFPLYITPCTFPDTSPNSASAFPLLWRSSITLVLGGGSGSFDSTIGPHQKSTSSKIFLTSRSYNGHVDAMLKRHWGCN